MLYNGSIPRKGARIPVMTIKDIAKAAGVSPSTVSKVINQKDDAISEETRQRVLQVIADSNYIPYAGVRGRLLAQNNQVALVMPSVKDPFLADFADQVQQLVRSRGYALTIQITSGQAESEAAILAELSDAYTAGLLFFPQGNETLAALRGDENNIAGAVLLDCSFPDAGFPQLCRDFAAAAETGANYLLKYDHRRIVLALDGSTPWNAREKMIEGYRAALSRAKIPYDSALVLPDTGDLEQKLGKQLDAGADAILCQDSFLAGEVYRVVQEKQYRIPDDVSVLCLEDAPALEHFSPAVTAIRTDAREMAGLAVDALLSQLSGGQTPAFVSTLPGGLVRRDSIKKHAKPAHKIVIAGSINMDVTLNVSRLPHSGETVLATGQSSWPGGKGANQAIGVSRFGGDAFMVGRLGSDLYGKQLFERLSREQVDMRGVTFSQDMVSGTAYINVQADGRNTIVVNPGANATVTPAYIEENRGIFTDAQYCLIQMEIPLETVVTIVRICNEEGIRVILKPSPAQELPDEVLKGLFLLVPNREEAGILVQNETDPARQAGYLLSRGVEHVIITLSEKGCLYAAGDGMRTYPAKEFPSVDATGASDIFISCLAARLSHGGDMESAIRYATIAASYSVSKKGVQNAIISPDLLEELYQSTATE